MNILIGIVIVLLIAMAFGNGADIVEKRQQQSVQDGTIAPTEAGSINCSLDRRHCTPGQRQ